LNLASGNVENLSAGTVSTQPFNQELGGYGTLFQVVGYAPNSFSNATDGSYMFLNNQPKSAPATSVNDPQLMLLPKGSRVVRAVATNNGVPVTSDAGNTTLDVGIEPWSASPAGNEDVFSGISLAANTNLSAPVVAGSVTGTTVTALGGSGTPLEALGPLLGVNGVTVGPVTGNLTSGDFALTLTYFVEPSLI